MPNIKWNPLVHQRKAFFSRKPFVGLVGGYGSGKTDWLCHKILQLAHENPRMPGGIMCPDLKMFKRDVWPTLEEIKERNRLKIYYNRLDSYIGVPETGSKIWVFHDQDYGESVRGPNLAFFGINEATLVSQAGFEACVGRVRLKDAKLPQVAWSGTPEGFGYLYHNFVIKERDDSDVVFGKTTDNPYLHPSYIEMLKATYDEKLLAAYLEGKFVNLNADRAAWAFDRAIHVSEEAEPLKGAPVWVSVDFNVNPMSAVLWSRIPSIDSKVTLRAFDEISLASSNTFELAKVIKQKVGTNVTIYPDPAGSARSTKSSYTDIGIIRDQGFMDIRYKRQIASVRDCLNALNNMFSKNCIQIHPRCKNFIADLEQCTLKNEGYEIDKKDPKRTHWLDGAKNMIEYEFPSVRPSSKIGVYNYA